MPFSVIPIGVNFAFTLTGFETNYLIQSGKSSLLFDCGTTAARALDSIGLQLREIENVYISHLHLDHVGGLVQLGLERYFAKLPRPKVFLHSSIAEEIWNNFLSGLISRFTDSTGKPLTADISTFFEFVPVSAATKNKPVSFSVAGLDFCLIEVQHVPQVPTHGLVINEKVFITSDTKFLPKLLEDVANRFRLEAIFHNCTFAPQRGVIHSTYDELLTLPEDLRQLLVLTHYEQELANLAQEEDRIQLPLAIAGQLFEFE